MAEEKQNAPVAEEQPNKAEASSPETDAVIAAPEESNAKRAKGDRAPKNEDGEARSRGTERKVKLDRDHVLCPLAQILGQCAESRPDLQYGICIRHAGCIRNSLQNVLIN